MLGLWGTLGASSNDHLHGFADIKRGSGCYRLFDNLLRVLVLSELNELSECLARLVIRGVILEVGQHVML